MNETTRIWDYLSSLPADEDGWRSVPDGLIAVDQRFGFRPRRTVEQVSTWSRAGLVEVRKAGPHSRSPVRAVRLIRKPGRSEDSAVVVQPRGNGKTSKHRLLDLLCRNTNERGLVTLSTRQIRMKAGLSKHDLVKLLFDLRDEGKIDATIRGTGPAMRPTAIRIRPAGFYREAAPEPTGRPEGAAGFPAGIQAPGATEGPEEAAPVQEIAAVVPVPQDVLDDAASIMDAKPPAFTAEAYPEIFALLEREGRREKIEEAARALEQAGLDDMAVQALEAIPSITPLEAEIRALIRIYWRKEWEQPGASLRETITGLRGDNTFDAD